MSPDPAPGSQRRLDELLGESPEAREERSYRDLRGKRAEAQPLPYEERVAVWIREREEAMRKKGVRPGPPPPPSGAAPSA